jgi:hypothetical protein
MQQKPCLQVKTSKLSVDIYIEHPQRPCIRKVTVRLHNYLVQARTVQPWFTDVLPSSSRSTKWAESMREQRQCVRMYSIVFRI